MKELNVRELFAVVWPNGAGYSIYRMVASGEEKDTPFMPLWLADMQTLGDGGYQLCTPDGAVIDEYPTRAAAMLAVEQADWP